MFRTLLAYAAPVIAVACGSPSPTPQSGTGGSALHETESPDEVEPAGEFSAWTVGPHPESVEIDGAAVYVTQFGAALEPQTQDGDGYVAVYDANGQFVDTLVSDLDAPKGTAVVDDVLYVADVDSLLGFETGTGERVSGIGFAGVSTYLNGLCVGPAGKLLLTATDAGKVWLVDVADDAVEEIADLPGANGVAYDAATELAYVVTYLQDAPGDGGVYRVDLASGSAERLGTYGGMLDGVAVVGDRLVVTDWNGGGAGRVVAVDLNSGAADVIAEDSTLVGPADFDVLGDGLTLIPTLLGDRVVAVRL